MNPYLIPANSKKSMLYLGFFNLIDLIILGTGIMFTGIMLFILKPEEISITALCITPALISCFLVMPVPYYHNIMQLIGNIFKFFTETRSYYWKGWCVCDDPKRRGNRRKNFE